MKKDFRFFDSRQKYLLFVTTTNEKDIIAEKISPHLDNIKPKKPSLKIFDAGLGDGTLLMSILRDCHRKFPTIPFSVVGKEISMEDVRLTIEKLPDRFMEHPNLVFTITNLHYDEAACLRSKNEKKQEKINWQNIQLSGNSSYDFHEQLSQLDPLLSQSWQVERHSVSGNPTYKIPSVINIYRKDQEFVVDQILPKNDSVSKSYDIIIASQPYRSRISVNKKVNYVVKPMIEALSDNGKLFLVHSIGKDIVNEIITKIWPAEKPFPSGAKEIVSYLKDNLDPSFLKEIIFSNPEIFTYNLRALPNEIENGIATSLIFSSWNAITYVGQIDDYKTAEAESNGKYNDIMKEYIKENKGLSFSDEMLVVKKIKKTNL